MAIQVHVSGPMRVSAGLLTDDGPTTAPTVVLGHSRDGVNMELEESWDDVFTDDLGPDGWRDKVMIGTKVRFDFELHSFSRSHLEDFLWYYENPGFRSRIGRKISNLDGAGNVVKLAFESETGTQDILFHRVAILNARQRIGTRHTVVTLRCEAIIDGLNDSFWSNAAITPPVTLDESPEVAGGAQIIIAGSDLGYTRDGLDLEFNYFYDDVNVDPKGPETNFEKVVTGQAVTVIMDFHAYDKTNMENLLAILAGAANYGKLNNIGRFGSDVAGGVLFLDSSLGAVGLDWTFDQVVLEGNPRHLFSARHSTVTQVRLVSIPLASTDPNAGRFYVHETGS